MCNRLADGECEDSCECKAGAADAEAACEECEAPTNDGRDDAREATVRHTKESHDTLDARTQKKVVVGEMETSWMR